MRYLFRRSILIVQKNLTLAGSLKRETTAMDYSMNLFLNNLGMKSLNSKEKIIKKPDG